MAVYAALLGLLFAVAGAVAVYGAAKVYLEAMRSFNPEVDEAADDAC